MIPAVFDTNILIDYLNGIAPARQQLDAFTRKLISGITYIEVLVGAGGDAEIIQQFLETFEIIWIDQIVADQAIIVKNKHALKLPDAIILATAMVNNALLLTRDAKLVIDDNFVRVPYLL